MSASPTASASATPMPTDAYKGRYTDIATIHRNMEFTEHRHYNSHLLGTGWSLLEINNCRKEKGEATLTRREKNRWGGKECSVWFGGLGFSQAPGQLNWTWVPGFRDLHATALTAAQNVADGNTVSLLTKTQLLLTQGLTLGGHGSYSFCESSILESLWVTKGKRAKSYPLEVFWKVHMDPWVRRQPWITKGCRFHGTNIVPANLVQSYQV